MSSHHLSSLNSDDGPLRAKLKKLLLCRLIIAVLFLLLTVAVQTGRNKDLFSSDLNHLYLFCSFLFLFTIYGALRVENVRRLARFTWIQILFDSGAVSVLVYLTGGIESSFSFLYMLVIIASALLLNRGAILTASACSLLYGLLLDLQYFGCISPLQIVAGTGYARDSGTYFHTILMNIAGFYLIGFTAGYLARELQKSSSLAREHKRDLHQLATLHQSIVHSMTSGLLTIDAENRIVFINTAGRDILGILDRSIIGSPVEELFPGLDFLKSSDGNIGHRISRMETVYKHPSGEEKCLGYTASELHAEGGGQFGWVILFRDLTQIKVIQERMERMERLIYAGRIAAEIAHELKNPLAAMSGAVQMLQSDLGEDPVGSRLIGIVQREILRINELVTDFLWLAKSSPKQEQIADVPVCAVIQEILSLLKSKKQLAGSHTIRTEFEANPLWTADPHHIRQILWNLLINAVEAMPEGGTLTIRVQQDNGAGVAPGQARIDISDTGCGLPEAIRNKIFDPFFTTKANGTGLGLSIVYQLVEEAGGRIETPAGTPGSGATFSLFFPPSKPFSLAK